MSAEPYYRKLNDKSKLKEKQSKAARAGLKPPTRVSPRNFWEPAPVRLTESEQEVKSYNDIWLSANQYLQRKADEMVSLPPDSSERLFVDALSGTLKQFEIRKEDSPSNVDLRNRIKLLADKLDSMFEGRTGHGELHEYMMQLSDGMMQLHNNISVDEAPDLGDMDDMPPGEPGEEAPGGPDEAGPGLDAPPEEEEGAGPPPEESGDIAKELGL